MKNPPAASSSLGVHVATRHAVSRRQFLRGVGVVLALPWLDSMLPGLARAAEVSSGAPGEKPRRMFAICNNLGLLPGQFFPAQSGRGYQLSPYLESLREHRDDFTVFSGVSHPDVDGGHPADICFLTAAPHPGSGGFRNTISLDQYIAERIGNRTRLPSLTLGVNVEQGVRSLSWTGSGVLIPCEEKASDVFKRLFVQGTPAEVDAQLRQLDRGKSILDAVAAQAQELQRKTASGTAPGWTSISRACATWRSACSSRASGNTGRSPSSRCRCRSIPPARGNTWRR